MYNQFNAYRITQMVSEYGRGTANQRNTRINISRRSPSTNMGNYPVVELGYKSVKFIDNKSQYKLLIGLGFCVNTILGLVLVM